MFFSKGCLRFVLSLLALFFIAVIGFSNMDWIAKKIYPTHYVEIVEKYSNEYSIDPYLVFSIMKNESKFDPRAVSIKEAKGLMQIAPVTGQWASEMLGVENYNEKMLFEPDFNIRIGVWYLTVLKKEFNNNIPVMVAGYNAGNGNVKKWLNSSEYSKNGTDLDHIPFGETRKYQERVLRDYKIYKKIYDSL